MNDERGRKIEKGDKDREGKGGESREEAFLSRLALVMERRMAYDQELSGVGFTCSSPSRRS
jgi:hypothetical protein